MLGKTTNPILQQTEQAIQNKVPQQLQGSLQHTVTAGLTIMYSSEHRQMMLEQLTKFGDPAKIVAEGTAKMMSILYQQSNEKMPIPVLIQGAVILMCEGIDYLSQLVDVEIASQFVAQVTQELLQYMLALLGVSQRQVHEVVADGMERMMMPLSINNQDEPIPPKTLLH